MRTCADRVRPSLLCGSIQGGTFVWYVGSRLCGGVMGRRGLEFPGSGDAKFIFPPRTSVLKMSGPTMHLSY